MNLIDALKGKQQAAQDARAAAWQAYRKMLMLENPTETQLEKFYNATQVLGLTVADVEKHKGIMEEIADLEAVQKSAQAMSKAQMEKEYIDAKRAALDAVEVAKSRLYEFHVDEAKLSNLLGQAAAASVRIGTLHRDNPDLFSASSRG